jgi:hypothetical protein
MKVIDIVNRFRKVQRHAERKISASTRAPLCALRKPLCEMAQSESCPVLETQVMPYVAPLPPSIKQDHNNAKKNAEERRAMRREMLMEEFATVARYFEQKASEMRAVFGPEYHKYRFSQGPYKPLCQEYVRAHEHFIVARREVS